MHVVETARQIQAAIYHAVDTAVVEVRKAAHSVQEKVKTIATRAFNTIFSPAKRVALRGQIHELQSNASACAHAIASSVGKMATRAFRSLSKSLESMNSSIQATVLRVDHQVNKTVSSILDTMIPSRKEARMLKGSVKTLSLQLQNALQMTEGFAASAETQNARFEEALRTACDAQELTKGFAADAKEQAARVDASEERAREFQKVSAHAANAQEARAERAERDAKEARDQLRKVSTEAESLKSRAEGAEGDAVAKTAQLEDAVRRIRALELQIETLRSEQKAAVDAAARPQALSPLPPAADNDAEVAAASAGLPEGGVEGAGGEDVERIATPAHHARTSRSRVSTNHAVKTPSLKVCLQGSGYPKRN